MKSISPKRLIAFASAISVSFFSLGQISNSPLLEETVVTANRVEQAVQDAIPATTLITQEQIQRSRALDLPSLLSQFTGIEIAQNGGMGTLSNVFLRGSESRHVLVLIDGIPLNNLNFNTVPLEALPLFSIDRIEIVRGNVSSLYGSSAMGGVINIFTKNTKKDWQQVQTQLGSFGYRSLQGGAGKSWDSGLAIAASAENAQNKGFNTINQAQRPGTNPDKDGFNLKATNVSLSQTLERGGVSLSLNELRMNTQFDSEFGPSSQADESKSILKNSAISGFLNPSKELTASLSLAQSSDDLNGFLSAFPFVVKSTKNVSTLGLVWKPNEINTITSGYESTNQKISSLSTKYGKTERDIHSARLGYHLNLNKHQIQLNTRQDQYSDFGNNNTGYGGYSYLITDQLRFLGSVSTGFMAPTFNDLYYPFGGNTKLIPETS
ncbi:MAG: TonB-dependent receptor, partial [Limnohabitans sp.]|nr:TonB-dependent receptor [Limnohabitans sp.]